MRAILIAITAATLAGCSYNLALMKRGAPDVAHGTATEIGKKVEIMLDNKVYRGTYAFLTQGQSSFGTAQAYGPRGVATAASQTYTTSAMGNGSVLARADDGSAIRCVFAFSNNTGSGMGECEDSGGGLWDLQISY